MRNIGILFLLLIAGSVVRAQDRWTPVGDWLEQHTSEMGGRSALVVYRDGRLVYSKTVGGYTTTSRQLIASCSKWLSAALVMTFVDEGKLNLSDTVGRYLPVLSQHGKGGITVRQCLSHLTGIKEPPLRRSLQQIRGFRSMDAAMDWVAGLPMEGEPGKVFHYSNAGLQIAGAILEKIDGKSFQDLFLERIARPLGMSNTDFGNGPVALPAGSASSTPEDYGKFLEMILNKGTYPGGRLLRESSIAEMEVNRITSEVSVAYAPVQGETGWGYGYGEWVLKGLSGGDGLFVSSPGLFGSFPWVDNGRHYCAFLMTFYLDNRGRLDRYKELKQLVDGALAK